MPMTTKAAQLHSMHKRKAERLWERAEQLSNRPTVADRLSRLYIVELAEKHEHAANAIYNCPDSWESEDTMTKLQEISAYLGLPLYKEWLEARGDTDFAEYVNDEYAKICPVCGGTRKMDIVLESGEKVDECDCPRCVPLLERVAKMLSISQREDAERDTDWQRQTQDLRNGG